MLFRSYYKDRSAAAAFGAMIEKYGLLTRAVFVVDENDKVLYVEYCEKIVNEPNYEAALAAAK